jgi:fibronectin type 3 domain-containing protein
VKRVVLFSLLLILLAACQEVLDSPPAPPTNLQATPEIRQIRLTWAPSESTNVAEYRVYRSTTEGVQGTRIADGVGEAFYLDTGVEAGTTYYYRVTAVDTENRESGLSNEASATPLPDGEEVPAPPTELTATPAVGQIELTWTASPDAATYNVYRSTASPVDTGAAPLATVDAPQTNYTDTAVEEGTTYYYRVTAVDAEGNESVGSNEVSETPAASPPPPPPGEVIVELDFTEALEGTLQDAQNQGTGFDTVQGPELAWHNPNNLLLNTGASTLTVTAEQGIQFEGNDNLENGLGYGLGARNEALTVRTELNKPSFVGSHFQQGGLWLGLDQDQNNYVKLVVIQDGGPRVEMLVEEGGQAPLPANRIRTDPLVIADGAPVELALFVSPDGTVSGFYAIAGGSLTALPGTLSIPQEWLASDSLAAGIMATRRFQEAELLFTFNEFVVEAAANGEALARGR